MRGNFEQKLQNCPKLLHVHVGLYYDANKRNNREKSYWNWPGVVDFGAAQRDRGLWQREFNLKQLGGEGNRCYCQR
jgi:hypothetical protein